MAPLTRVSAVSFLFILACAEASGTGGTGGDGGATSSGTTTSAVTAGPTTSVTTGNATSVTTGNTTSATTGQTTGAVTSANATTGTGGACDPITCAQQCLMMGSFGMCQGNMCVCGGGFGGFGFGGGLPFEGEVPDGFNDELPFDAQPDGID